MMVYNNWQRVYKNNNKDIELEEHVFLNFLKYIEYESKHQILN